MFALVDCNNFYASCERIFRPDLQHRPIVVLSNNDGCVVARSSEARALGIPMGAPWFKVKRDAERQGVKAFSSNYTLYGDISARVVETLNSMSSTLEVYSIDECFIDLRGLPKRDWIAYGQQLRERVWRDVRVPVSVGLAPTKTLAKLANRVAKKEILKLQRQGVCSLDEALVIKRALGKIDVGDVWGIGPAHKKRLHEIGVLTAHDFTRLHPKWVRKKMTVVGWSTQQELRGIPVLNLELSSPPRKSMVFSRAFAEPISDLNTLREAVASYASRLGAKLRKYDRKTHNLRLFLQGRFGQRQTLSSGCTLPVSSNDSRVLVQKSLALLDRLLRRCDGSRSFAKAGVLALNLHDASLQQADLFTTPRDPSIMITLDSINQKFGRGVIRLASEGHTRTRMRQDRRSPRYTTHWNELPSVTLPDRQRAPSPQRRGEPRHRERQLSLTRRDFDDHKHR